MVKSDAYPANQSYGFEAPLVGREEEDDLVDEARGRAVTVSADAAATKRVEVRILVDYEEDGDNWEEGYWKADE